MKFLRCSLFFAMVGIASLSANAGHHEPEEQPKSDLTVAVNQFMDAFENESVEMFESIMAKDSDMVTFGTDASERWVGFDAVRDSFAKQVDTFEVEKIDTKDQVIKMAISGKVAWFSQVVDWQIASNGNSQIISGIRVTGVLEKRGPAWKIVQFHTSAPVEGQIVEY